MDRHSGLEAPVTLSGHTCAGKQHLSVTPHPPRYEECKEKLVPFLKKVGFNPKKDIHFMPCSGLTGANLKEPAELCSWYT